MLRTLLGGCLVAGGCGRKRANRFPGRLFVSSAAERGIAVADLSEFRRMTTIALPASASRVLHFGGRVIALCPDAALLVQIDPDGLSIVRTLRLPARPVALWDAGRAAHIAVLGTRPDCVMVVSPESNRVLAHLSLPGRAEAMDVWNPLPGSVPDAPTRAAVTVGATQSLVRLALPECRIIGSTPLGATGAPLRFRPDGETLLIGAGTAREIITVEWTGGALLARLPVAIDPHDFCFTSNDNGGQMFVTGSGADAVTIVAPYQNEVYETIPAGRTPGAMTVSADGNLLLVANSASGDLTILDIQTRRLVASVHVGDNPKQVLVTPDGQYALVVNRGSGTVAVVRLKTVLNPGGNLAGLDGVKAKPLFTMFAITSAPENAIIVPEAV